MPPTDRRGEVSRRVDESHRGEPSARAAEPAPELPMDPDLTEPPEWTTRADWRTTRGKLAAGLLGLKHAVRGDSSFFVHAYRGLLVVLAGALLGIGPMSWCLLALAAGLVLVAELCHSAVDTLARAVGDPEERALKAAREIAAAGVLIAVVVTAAIAITVLVLRLGELFAWW